MPFCMYAKEDNAQNLVTVDSLFINSYMKDCGEKALKVYLFGLYLCSNPLSKANNLETIKIALELSEDEILEAFRYWQTEGLVSIVSEEKLEVIYHSPRNRTHFKTFKKEKYSDFNKQMEDIFSSNHMITPNQFLQYYEFIEASNIDPNALVMIAQHCVKIKGLNVAHSYILQLAKSWVLEGIRACGDVSEKIRQRELNSGILREIAEAIGKTSIISEEDKDYYEKWTKSWGFDKNAIIAASKKSLKSFAKLDDVLDECFENNAYDALEVENYFKNKKKFINCAIQVANSLGCWMDNTAPYVTKYIKPWSDFGYSFKSLEKLAGHCFENQMRDFALMDSFIESLVNKNIISDEKVNEYFKEYQKLNEQIKKIFDIIGLTRFVRSSDRDTFSNWVNNWQFSTQVIEYVAKLHVAKPFSEITKTLALLKEKNIIHIEDVKKYYETNKGASKGVNKFNESDKKYTKSQLESHFISPEELDEVDF